MRRAAKIDDNQNEIVKALRQSGASVQTLAAVGQGVPDILVGYRGRNLCVEIKDGGKCPSKRKLTADQVKWHSEWKGQVCVVESVDEAVALIKQPTKCTCTQYGGHLDSCPAKESER